jgi:Terminase large subunit, T4likevirus-type, N-terminal
MSTEALGKTIVRSAHDLFAAHFLPVESWSTWLTLVLPVLFGLPIDAEKLPLFQRCTGRTQLFQGPVTEAWFLCGRRSGKSRFLALIAVCIALFRDYRQYIAPGERPLVMILACDKDQAQTIFGYARALILETPMLASMIERETADTMDLTNGVSIGVHTSSYKSVRGRTLAAALCDEAAFWRSDDSRNPAEAVIRALRPALSTIPGAPLLVASSTYAQDGVLYDAYQKHHGKDTSSVLVWKADTLAMNPSFRKDVIDAAYATDAKDAAAEYGAEWLSDVRQFLPDELIDAAIMADRRSLPKSFGVEHIAFCDPSGGVSDAMVLAVAHMEAGRIVVLDRLEAITPPFLPEDVVQRFADILSSYGLSSVTGDRYGAAWVSTMFRRFGITYKASEFDKSAIYVAAQPLFAQKIVELLDVPKLAGELRRLERRPRPGGRDLVDHIRGSHDDLANAACGALVLASKLQWSGRSVYQAAQPSRHASGSDYDPIMRNERESAKLRGERFNE